MTKRLLTTQKIVNLAADPVTGTAGEIYFNTVSNQFRYYSGTSWTNFASGVSSANVTISDTPPVTPSEGDLWFSSSSGIMYVYYDSFWIEFSGSTYGVGSGGGGSQDYLIATTSVNYLATASDQIIRVNAISGELTVTLPTATLLQGKSYIIKKVDASVNHVVVSADGTETIDGSNDQRLTAQYEALTLVSDGSNWMIV